MTPRRRREHSEQVVLPSGILLLDDRVGVLLDDAVLDADLRQIAGRTSAGKARLLLVEVHRDQAEVDRRPLAQAISSDSRV
jgi:hypothetical protein